MVSGLKGLNKIPYQPVFLIPGDIGTFSNSVLLFKTIKKNFAGHSPSFPEIEPEIGTQTVWKSNGWVFVARFLMVEDAGMLLRKGSIESYG